MAISVRCPSCERDYQVRESFAGRSVPCKSCGAVFAVPRSSKSAAAVNVVEFEDPPAGKDDYDAYRPKRPATRPGRRPAPAARPVAAAPRPSAPRRRSSPRRRSGPPKGLAILMVVLAGISVVVASSLAIYKFAWKRSKGADPADPRDGFAVAKAKVPSFPDLPAPRVLQPSGARVFFVDLARQPGNGNGPGERMKLRVYLPPGNHPPKSLGCILVAPAGTTLLHGNDMDDDNDHAETLPYVRAGYAVVFYSLDGPLNDPRRSTDAEAAAAYREFKAAKAGVLNGRNALEFVLAKLPQVDYERIYCAGHSSAGTLSLLLAAHEPRIKGCIAYAPATDLEQRLKQVVDDPASRRAMPGLRDFVKRSSPKTHAEKIGCPIFIHHSRDDANEPFQSAESFVRRLRSYRKNVTFSISIRGGHYRSMLNPGIPRAIAWLKDLPAERAARQRFGPPPDVPRPFFGNRRPAVRTTGLSAEFRVLRFAGGDPEAAARRALANIDWIDTRSVRYDAFRRRIVARVTKRTFNTSSALQSLRRQGFTIGLTRVTSRRL
jgi:dienelactone hydrolase/ribosomal protein S27E